jgi:hypothetical protein
LTAAGHWLRWLHLCREANSDARSLQAKRLVTPPGSS